MQKGVDMSVSTKHYNRLVKEGKTAEASALMSIQSGALWSPQRLEEAGIEAENGVHKCPLCGKEGTDEGHLFWECPKVCQTLMPGYKKQTDTAMNIADRGWA